MNGILLLTLLLAAVGWAQSYRLVLGRVGTCSQRKAYGIVRMKKYHCRTMGGAWNGNPSDGAWIDCHLDMCLVPSSGRVSSGYAWGIDPDQSSSSHKTRIYGISKMTRRDCDKLHGRYNGNPSVNDWIDCHLYWERMDGSDRQKITAIILCGVGECESKVGYAIVKMTHRQCIQINGAYNGNPGANDWIDCHLDVAVSPIIDCVPSDAWRVIDSCQNTKPYEIDCSFSETTGIERGTSSTSTNGGSVEVSITSEVSAELKGVFSASVSTSFTTGFNWERSVTDHEIWSKSHSKTITISVPAHDTVKIEQAVGQCGGFNVKTPYTRIA